MTTRSTYDRIAGMYDMITGPMEFFGGARRRERVIRQACGRTLEVGIGTGVNMPDYMTSADLTGVEISEPMLARAGRRAQSLKRHVNLVRGDVQSLSFPDSSFDTVVATCVFCSVTDPVRGLAEIRRVIKPDGKVLLLEHVRPRNALLGKLADLLSPFTRRIMGPEINRRTEENVTLAGLHIAEVRAEGVWREILAQKENPEQPA